MICSLFDFCPQSAQSRRHVWNTINQWSICQLLECQAAPHKRKVPLLKTWWAVLPFYIALQLILSCCYCTDKSLDACICARFKVNCEVIPLSSLANFKFMMSRHTELRKAPRKFVSDSQCLVTNIMSDFIYYTSGSLTFCIATPLEKLSGLASHQH